MAFKPSNKKQNTSSKDIYILRQESKEQSLVAYEEYEKLQKTPRRRKAWNVNTNTL